MPISVTCVCTLFYEIIEYVSILMYNRRLVIVFNIYKHLRMNDSLLDSSEEDTELFCEQDIDGNSLYLTLHQLFYYALLISVPRLKGYFPQ